MIRKPAHILARQKRHSVRAASDWEKRRQKAMNITHHIQAAFKAVLEKAGFVCICAPQESPERGMLVFDDEGTRFTLTTQPMVDRSRDPRTTVKVHKSVQVQDPDPYGFGNDPGKPFFSWDSLKEPRPHKAALLLAKKLKMNPVHEVMDA